MRLISTAKSALLAALLALAAGAGAHEHGDEVVTPLQHQALPDAPGKSGVMAVVAYGPGQSSVAHRHPGSIFAYVLEGEVVSQLQGGATVTYKAGESWYEAPNTPHLVSRNASSTKPAKLLVWSLVQDGQQLTVPLQK
ncbi:cupin domain-containing protein [Herbaspirillum rhizosphaerae]|uniref:cupin domain-containing protein n=1 Tax=Herbaspirillum rhizosphaerae TaxID=346179 RepID=UPI00067D5A17|nr:cupin domain-containing protein [Herbaspirillum rhizosphaerae]